MSRNCLRFSFSRSMVSSADLRPSQRLRIVSAPAGRLSRHLPPTSWRATMTDHLNSMNPRGVLG
jgi:hypothetical protein